MKFLFLTDTHYRDDRPKGRTDDIMKAQFDELADVMRICNERNIDIVLHGGDFFNTKKPSHNLVVHILNWAKFLNRPIMGVIGNHDVTGYNLDSVSSSGLGVLFEAGALERLDTYINEEERVIIKAVHSSLGFERNYLFGEQYKDFTRIIISHNYVIPSESMPWGFIHPRDIETDAHLVLCGHYHVAYDYTSGQTRWINPGAVSRWKITERDHTPQVLIVTVENGKLEVEHVKLPSALPGDVIFDVEAVEVQKQQERNIDSFAKSLEETSFQNVDIEQVVEAVAKKQNVPEAIVSLILSKIKEAKETLK
jgi:exonuclease SbcD